ncbi:aryl hydrocarbon receptor-like isoform X2 [Trichosurus vulpecula]|uniref:aryl hydrocarbon receptor-like isoform X2 n=1 Tax=Trichosurus vulpecula TaxID=9337 RepID=UPI00186AF6DB|nr:aryl hydrocarbon receptor-like isoform X2 [Trichosurus vulpecula]
MQTCLDKLIIISFLLFSLLNSPRLLFPGEAKSNPSKRHRDCLNQELNKLTNLLPFPEDVRARLDKLSILRLAVGYLKLKGYFKAILKNPSTGRPDNQPAHSGGNVTMPPQIHQDIFSEGDLLLQALQGFFIAVTEDGYILYVSPTVQDYLGFHQSDIIYQSVFELIHADDRDMFRCQLHWSLNPPSFREAEQDSSSRPVNKSPLNSGTTMYESQHLSPENPSLLERRFVCRFCYLLDSFSGFMALNFHGGLKFLHGQNKKAEDGSLMPPQLVLFAIATPCQPLSILELRVKIYIFQTKHKLDFTPIACDTRGQAILGYTETEFFMKGSGYQFIHVADMMYCAEKHARIMKMGESGMSIFRLLTKKAGWLWVQSNARLVYKGGQPDYIITRQRVISNEEGEEHLHKRATSQLPFNFVTGEAVLYDKNHPGFLSSLPPRERSKARKEAHLEHDSADPDSLLEAMMQQDESACISRTVPPSSFSFTDVMQTPREWCPNDKNGKIISDETDSLSAIIETLLEENETESDICQTIQNLDVDDLELQKWEENMFLVNQVGSPSFQGRLQQGVTLLTDEVILSPEKRKYVDFPPLNITKPLQSLEQQAPLMGPSHQTTPVNPLQHLFMNHSKEMDAGHPWEHYWHSLGPDTVVHLPPGLQEILLDLPQQIDGQSHEGPLTFGMGPNSICISKIKAASSQANPMATSSHQSHWYPLEPSLDNSTTVFLPKHTTSLSLEKVGFEEETQHRSGCDASAQSVQFQTHEHRIQWQDPEPAEISVPGAHQGPPQGMKPSCNLDSLTLGEPMEVEPQFQMERAQTNILGNQETSPWISSRLADYPQGDIKGMGIPTFSNPQQAQRTMPPCFGQQPIPLEGPQIPGGSSSCWPIHQQRPSPATDVYSEQQVFSTQHQQHLVQGTEHSVVPCGPALAHPGVPFMGEVGPSIHHQITPDREASCQGDRRFQTTWQRECLFSSPEYQCSIPTVERDISLQATHVSPFLGSPHLISKLGDALPSCTDRLTGSAPGREANLELDWSLPPQPLDPPFSHMLLFEQQPDGQPIFTSDVH